AFSLKIPSNTVTISYINDRKISINTTNGIKLFDLQTKSFSDLIFKDFSITSAYQDKENNFWLTTAGAGVLVIPSFQFRNYFFSGNKASPEITILYLKNDTVYSGGRSKKIWKVNVNTLLSAYQFASYHEGTKLISLVPVHDKLFPVFSSFCPNPFNPKKRMTRLFYSLSIKSASIGKSGIFFATNATSHLFRWSGKDEIVWQGRSTSVVEKDSGFYIGTLNGLYYKSYEGKIANLGKLYPVFTSRIANLAVSYNGILWVTTKGNGIAAYSDNKLLYHFTAADGLTSDNCTSVYLDSNIVWVGTEKGLNRIEISAQRYKITRFTMSDGLPSNIINAIATKGNKVFVGTPKGLTYFEVDKISQTSACDLQLTGIYIVNKYWAYDSTGFSLPHKDNDIRFEFSGISFKSAGEMTYKYRLLGLQTEWRTTTEKQLSFPSLGSGKYSLELKAINKYGVESKKKEIVFTIGKLFWEKTWFRLMVILLLAAGVWAFITYRIRKIKQKEKEQTKLNQRIAELEQKALRSQMNPHFIFNCLNSIQQFVAEKDITGVNSFITDFSRLIRMTLDLSTHALINMSDEMEYITTYLKVEKTRLEDQFDYRINIDQSLDLQQIYLPPLLLQPYVENSIRHGIKYRPKGDGLIQINVEKKGNDVLISIEDNGIGRKAAKKYNGKYHIQYQSRGMSINEDRIKILNNFSEKKIQFNITDLYNPEKEAVGTRVDIYLS
ncbi:MAG TPA: histidine kinase, partial [Chitinophagaceae bacterium]|nr:histidine kinase [Chitinophagaceae bacterium]